MTRLGGATVSALAIAAVALGLSVRRNPSVAEPAPPCAGRYAIELHVDPGAVHRSFSVASVDLDLGKRASTLGVAEPIDTEALDVVALDEQGRPRAFDDSAPPEDRFRVPFRFLARHPGQAGELHFVVRDGSFTRFLVCVDARSTQADRPARYSGLVGDGDLFREKGERREIAASGYDAFADLDGDGDLDLVKGGTESTLRYYENVGGGRYVERGVLASQAAVLRLPHDPGNRSWVSVGAGDIDGDGDDDLLLYLGSGDRAGEVLVYENQRAATGRFELVERGALTTESGALVAGPVTIADWDGDGRGDVIASVGVSLVWHRNLGPGLRSWQPRLAEAEPLVANGVPIQLKLARADCGDLDGDGDLDLVVGSDEGRVYLFENVGTRRAPSLAVGRLLVYQGFLDARAGVKLADFDGDGRLDLVVGRFWERTSYGDGAPVHGRLYRSVGSPGAIRFEERDAWSGAPYVAGPPIVDALRQNGPRVADWDQDGRKDLIVGDTDGFVWFFRGDGSRHFPLFEPGRRLRAGGRAIRVLGEETEGRRAGYARPEVVDWNDDGLPDLLVADGRGWLTLFLNRGRRGSPELEAGVRVEAAGRPIDGTGRASVLVADWTGDGRKDVIFAMAGEDVSAHYDWPHLHADPSQDAGFLLYRNVGSDAAPVLAAPEWVQAGRFGGDVIDIERPNLGAYVDWDGDGNRDFVACEFEDRVLLFRNDPRRPSRPRFRDPVGELLLAAETREMISGVDVVDWDGDGQLDLVTGMGHGGSGVRLFSHDYVRDLRDGTLPRVEVRSLRRLVDAR